MRWITCEEQMPEERKYESDNMQRHHEWMESDRVLVWDSLYGPGIDSTRNGKWMSEQRGGYQPQVIHGIIAWMPIPKFENSKNNMITEDYVSLDVAKLLKEKGFEGVINAYYHIWDNGKRVCSVQEFSHSEAPHLYIPAPTLQMAMKWLREEHNKTIIIGIRATDPITGIIDCYYNGIYYVPKNNGGALCFTSPTPENGYSTYEEACEAAIKYCLENLI